MSGKYVIGFVCLLLFITGGGNCFSGALPWETDSNAYRIQLVVKTRQAKWDISLFRRERYPDIKGVIEISGYRFDLPEAKNARPGDNDVIYSYHFPQNMLLPEEFYYSLELKDNDVGFGNIDDTMIKTQGFWHFGNQTSGIIVLTDRHIELETGWHETTAEIIISCPDGGCRPFAYSDQSLYNCQCAVRERDNALIGKMIECSPMNFSLMNPVTEKNPQLTGSAEDQQKVKRLHSELTIVDMHADSLLWNKDLLQRNSYGHVDVPRLIEGNVALQGFGVVSEAPLSMLFAHDAVKRGQDLVTALIAAQGWPLRTWNSRLQRALYQADKFQAAVSKSNSKLTLITDRQGLTDYLNRRCFEPDITAGYLAIEGLQVLEGRLENVQTLYDAGFRMMSFNHFFDNEVSGSAHGVEKGGLTDFGRDVILKMDRLGIVIDLAHSSPRAMDDIFAMILAGEISGPVVISHGGVKGTCNSVRNISDDHLDLLAATDGVIGIGYWEAAVCGTDAQSTAKAIRYVADRIGIDHVGLGSDFDGMVKTHFDTSNVIMMTEALQKEGFSDWEIHKIMGKNTLRVLMTVLPDAL